MTKDEMDSFVNDNMHKLKDVINDITNQFPFNLAKDLSDRYRHCDIQKLYNAINKLDPKYKTALILRYKYKYTYKRIAETLGCCSGSNFVSRILYKLKWYHDIYVYDKDYLNSHINKYKDKINSLKTEINRLNKNKEYLMDQVLKDNHSINRANLESKMDDAFKLMNTSINDLNLSTRAYNALINKKYDNLYELSHITIEDLWKTRDLGTDTIKEIVDKLYYKGIYIEHKTIKHIKTGQVKYISKNDKSDYKSWKFI